MTPRDDVALRVRSVERLAPTLKRLVLEPAGAATLPVASAGAHVTLTLEGADGRRLRNAYSLVAGHGGGAYELIVRRTGGARGGSAYVHDRLDPGVTVTASVPHNLFPLLTHPRKHLLIGGGIGVTPLLSYLPALRATGGRLELHQVASREEAPVFKALLAEHARGDVHVHAGRESLDLPALFARQPLGTHIYTCGPAALMDHVEAAAAALGWPPRNVHRENFGAAGGEPFVVRLASAGREIAVGPDESMLAALEAAGLDPPSLCRGGVCGECLTRVVAGEPEHRDHFLSDAEKASNTLVMPCVSRARGGVLVLDL